MTVKPLANAVANHAYYDRQKDAGENFHDTHLLSVARLEKGDGAILAQLVEFWKSKLF